MKDKKQTNWISALSGVYYFPHSFLISSINITAAPSLPSATLFILETPPLQSSPSSSTTKLASSTPKHYHPLFHKSINPINPNFINPHFNLKKKTNRSSLPTQVRFGVPASQHLKKEDGAGSIVVKMQEQIEARCQQWRIGCQLKYDLESSTRILRF